MRKILLIVMLLAGTNIVLCAGSEVELLGQACDGGYAAKCYDLGVIYRDGRIIDQDNLKAKELFKKACDGGDTHGCAALGAKNEADTQGVESASADCSRQAFKKYAKKLDKSKIESVDILKENYNKTILGQSKHCKSLLFSDFRDYYDQTVEAYIASIEEKLNEKYPLPAKKEKKYKAKLAKVGLIIYQSEGMYYVEADSAWFSKEFAASLSDEWKVFLKQLDYEAKNRFIDDEAVMISWEDLRKRVIFWEKFLDDHQDFVEKNRVKEHLSLYAYIYLRGSGNSPIYDWEGRELKDDVKESYENFIKINKKSKYYDLVKRQYTIIKAKAFKIDKKTSKKLDDNYNKSAKETK